MDLQLENQVVCVTGGSRGVGKAVTSALLREGANVSTCGRNAEDLRALREQSAGLPGTLLANTVDVRRTSELESFFKKTADHFGGIDATLVNAGQGLTGSVLESPTADFTDQFEIKVISGLETVRMAVPFLRKSKAPRIVIVNGVSAHAPESDMAAVSCSRAALSNLGVLLAQELAAEGITVNRLNLGPIATERQQARYQEAGSSEPFAQWSLGEAARRQVPLGRFGSESEVVPWLLLMLSPLASFVTGAELNVSGGLGARV